MSKENLEVARKLQVRWLPALVLTDGERIHHSWIGFLQPKWFQMELLYGRAQAAFSSKDFAGAVKLFDQVVAEYPQMERAPEALYWKAISTYRQTGNFPDAIPTFKEIASKYPQSIWARKAEPMMG